MTATTKVTPANRFAAHDIWNALQAAGADQLAAWIEAHQ